MRVGRVGRFAGAPGVMLLLGACEVHVADQPPPAPPPAQAAPAAEVAVDDAEPGRVPGRRRNRRRQAEVAAQPPPPPPPAEPWAAPLPPAGASLPGFPHRIVHPSPLETLGTANLDVHGIVLRPDRKCGPRQLEGGHWIHLDCNVHTPIASAIPASTTAKMIDLWRKGLLHGDDDIAGATAASPSAGAAAGAAGGTGAATPGTTDHRQSGTEGPVKDQGQVGSCTAFSLSSAMDNAIRRQNKGDTMSSMHIWSHYGIPTMQTAATANAKKPIAAWGLWPYDERVACEMDASGQAGDCGPYSPPVQQGAGAHDAKVQGQIKAADAAGQWKVVEYDAVPMDPDSIAAVLASGSGRLGLDGHRQVVANHLAPTRSPTGTSSRSTAATRSYFPVTAS